MRNDTLFILKKLATFFPKPLYVVGGAVRNALLNQKNSDIDLAGAVLPEKVFEILKDTEFKVYETNKKLFTLKIVCGEEYFEYTSFRKDSYPSGGCHTPCLVESTEDIEVDAKRRDFKINAIYYDVAAAKIVDPLNGRGDLENRLISTTIDPDEVFSQDGLRLMRLARQAAELGFSIEEKTKRAAQKNAALILDAAPERVCTELKKIMTADLTNGIKDAEIAGLRYLDELKLLEYVLPEIAETKGVSQRADFHKYDVFEHLLHVVSAAPPSVRFAALFHDAAKPAQKKKTGSMKGHAEAGAVLAETVMKRLKFSNDEISKTARLVALHMFDYNLKCSEEEIRCFIQDNSDIISDVIALRIADHKGKGIATASPSPSAERLKRIYDKMTAEGIPLSIKDLLVKGEELIALGIPPRRRSEALRALLKAAANDPSLLNYENQIEFIKNYEKSS